MKAQTVLAFMLVCLLHFPAIFAEDLELDFAKAWGSGVEVSAASKGGRIEYTTDGKGHPDYLVAPLKHERFEKKALFFELKIETMANYSGFEIRLGDEQFKNYYAFSIPHFADPSFNLIQDDYWQTYSFGPSNARVVGRPQGRITHMGLYIQDNAKGPLHLFLRNIRFSPAPETGYVSLTFDDGYQDQYQAASIMGRYGMAGTAYVMPRQIGLPSYMRESQLEELRDRYHWSISSHNEIPYTDFKPAALIKEVEYTLDYLDEHGFSRSAPHLAYPMGRQDRQTVLPIVRRFFDTARVAGGGVETLPPADPYLLRAVNVLDSSTPEALMKIVKDAVANGQWAILMFHHLVDEPKTQLDYRNEDFVKFIDLLGQAHIPVLPLDKAYRSYQQTRSAKRE